MALFNRLVINPTRFRGSHRGDAILILAWIGVLLVCMELNYATRIAEGAPEALGQWRPIASALASIFRPLGSSSEALIVLHGIFFWAHLTLVFGFLVYLGYSKHLHIITSVPNVFFKNEQPKGALRTLDIEAVMNAENEADQHFGAGCARALLVEGHARSLHVHRVRPVSDPLPRIQHRQAALAEDVDHRPARPRVREPRRRIRRNDA